MLDMDCSAWEAQVRAAQVAIDQRRATDALRLALRVSEGPRAAAPTAGSDAQAPGDEDDSGLDAAPMGPWASLKARALCVAAQALRMSTRFPDTLEYAQRAAVMARRAGEPMVAAQAMTLWTQAAVALGSLDEAIELAQSLLAQDASGWPVPLHAQAWNYIGLVHLWAQDWDRAHEALIRAMQACGQMDPPADASQPLVNRMYAHLYRVHCAICAGEDARALQMAQEMAPFMDLFRRQPPTMGLYAEQRGSEHFMFRSALALQVGLIGDPDEGLRLLQQAREDTPPDALKQFADLRCMLLVAEYIMQWRQGRHALAAQMAEQMVVELAPTGHRQMLHLGTSAAARFHELAGQPNQALAALKRAHDLQTAMQSESLRARQRLAQLRAATGPAQPGHEAETLPARLQA